MFRPAVLGSLAILVAHVFWWGDELVAVPLLVAALTSAALFATRKAKWSVSPIFPLVVVVAVDAAAFHRAMERRTAVDSVLQSSDPCVALPADAERRLDASQRLARDERRARCDARRSTEACERLAKAIDARAPLEQELDPLNVSAPVRAEIERLVKHAPSPADLLATPDQLPCSSQTWPRRVAQLARSSDVWTNATDVGPAMERALVAEGLSPDSKAALRARVVDVAGATVSDATPRKRLCAWVDAFGAGPAPACHADAGSSSDGGTVDGGGDAGSLRDEIRHFQSCVTDCGKNRTPEQRRADEAAGAKVLERERNCFKECEFDAGCRKDCDARHPVPVSSVEVCVKQCQQTYPRWNRPLP